jgi:hypothetical protein
VVPTNVKDPIPDTVELIVTVSVPELVVIVIPDPPTSVRVSAAVSAAMVACPATAILVKLGAVEKSNPLVIKFHAEPVNRQDF